MRIHVRYLIVAVAFLLLSTVSFADRPQCPVEHGACFIDLEGVPQLLGYIDADGDAIAFFWTGTNDEGTKTLPDGTEVVHGSDGGQEIAACDAEFGGIDCIIDWFFFGIVADELMFGEGNSAFNWAWNACSPRFQNFVGTAMDGFGQEWSIRLLTVMHGPGDGTDCIVTNDDIKFKTINH